MKTRQYQFSRQLRQLRYASKRLNFLLKSGKFYQLSKAKQQKLLRKLKKLVDKLSGAFSTTYLRKITAGAAVVLGLGVGTPMVQAQSFASPITNPFGFVSYRENVDGPTVGITIDLDNDGDLDLLTHYEQLEDNRIVVYFENNGSSSIPSFAGSDPLINPFGLDSLPYISTFDAVDIDNDGDQDLFVGNYEEGTISFYENAGTPTSPNFIEGVVNPMGLSALEDFLIPIFVDIDNDGDQDLFIGEEYGHIKFFENVGTPTAANFATFQENPFGLELFSTGTYLSFYQFTDIDNDGDFDILYSALDYAGGAYNGGIFFQENVGTPENPTFSGRIEDPFGLTAPYYLIIPEVADMDNDGDDDVWMGGPYDGSLFYFENTMLSSTIDFPETVEILLSPNPTSDVLQLVANFPNAFSTFEIRITNALGQLMEQKEVSLSTGQLKESWSVKNWPKGVYSVTIRANEMQRTLKLVRQ